MSCDDRVSGRPPSPGTGGIVMPGHPLAATKEELTKLAGYGDIEASRKEARRLLKEAGAENLTFDHVRPKSLGGQTSWSNVVAACEPCNLRKGNLMPRQADMFPLQAPKQPSVKELQANGRAYPPNFLHESWRDYLYWDSELDPT